jgi:phenylacetate-CoA ligase
MYGMACLIEEAGVTLTKPPKCVVSGSDALLPNYEATIRRVFQAPVTEQYGMTEFAGNLSKCEAGKFHVDFECCVVEQIPIEDSNCCKLLLTGWGNPAMPFIRYELGDYAVPCNSPCTCGRQSQSYQSIDGRLEDYIVTPDGRKIIGMNQVFEYAKHAKEIQLVQNEVDAVEFRIVPDPGFGDLDKQALTREFSRRAGADMKITFRIVQQITRSSTGKFRAVISGLK